MLRMVDSPLQLFSRRLVSRLTTVKQEAEQALAHANGNATRNTYLALSKKWTLDEAESLDGRFGSRVSRSPMFGVPVSLKDCFDLKGFRTTCGTKFYEALNGTASTDSAMAAHLRS